MKATFGYLSAFAATLLLTATLFLKPMLGDLSQRSVAQQPAHDTGTGSTESLHAYGETN